MNRDIFPIKRILIAIFVISLIAFYLLPIAGMVNMALKPMEELATSPSSIVKNPELASFGVAWDKIGNNFVNSLQFTIPATIISVILGSMAGYVFSKIRFRGAGILFFVAVLALYIPPTSIIIPLTKFMSSIGLFNTTLGLVFVHIVFGMPITTLLFRNYYSNIPDDLVESAKIAGCGTFDIYRRILLPLSAPGFVVVAIFQFTNIWNEFFIGVTLTMGEASQPVTVAVANLVGTTFVPWNIQMAGALIMAIPVIVVYIVLMKWVIRGLLAGAVTGK